MEKTSCIWTCTFCAIDSKHMKIARLADCWIWPCFTRQLSTKAWIPAHDSGAIIIGIDKPKYISVGRFGFPSADLPVISHSPINFVLQYLSQPSRYHRPRSLSRRILLTNLMIILFFQLFRWLTDMPCAGSTVVAKDGRGPRDECHVSKRMIGNHGTRRIMKTLGI